MIRRLHGPLAPALIVFFAACTAAVQDKEETGESSSAVKGDDDDDDDSTTTKSTKPVVKATAVAGGGFSCSAGNVDMPKELPNITTCVQGSEKNCEGWTPVGARLTSSAELRSQVDKGAQLYKIAPGANTLCLYLYRGDATASKGSLNGVHCWNKTTCDVCWWDSATAANVKPTAAGLQHSSGDDCSSCHRNGPLLPKFTLWEKLQEDTVDLHQVCSEKGGPTWADPETQGSGKFVYPNARPDLVVAAPNSCTGGCHDNGFTKGVQYCTLISHAFSDIKADPNDPNDEGRENGSMLKAGKKFKDAAECEKFLTDMECSQAVKEHQVNCNDPAVSGK